MSMKVIELKDLPRGAKVLWHNLYEDPKGHFHDEDITYIKLRSGIQIDAGQYGRKPSFFKVAVVPASGGGWNPVEEVICRTTHEVAEEIVRLARKYSTAWYAKAANSHGPTLEQRKVDLLNAVASEVLGCRWDGTKYEWLDSRGASVSYDKMIRQVLRSALAEARKRKASKP